jgi:hypothetical protein
MRYLKSYKLFEEVDVKDIESFKELFYNFKDDGFDISITENNTQRLDFSEKDSLTSFEIPDYKSGKTIVITTIDVKVCLTAGTNAPNFKSFDIDEVKENLLFAQSYAKDELGLKIEYIYIVTKRNAYHPYLLVGNRNWKYIYYKSIDVLPSNIMVSSVTISFTNM